MLTYHLVQQELLDSGISRKTASRIFRVRPARLPQAARKRAPRPGSLDRALSRPSRRQIDAVVCAYAHAYREQYQAEPNPDSICPMCLYVAMRPLLLDSGGLDAFGITGETLAQAVMALNCGPGIRQTQNTTLAHQIHLQPCPDCGRETVVLRDPDRHTTAVCPVCSADGCMYEPPILDSGQPNETETFAELEYMTSNRDQLTRLLEQPSPFKTVRRSLDAVLSRIECVRRRVSREMRELAMYSNQRRCWIIPDRAAHEVCVVMNRADQDIQGAILNAVNCIKQLQSRSSNSIHYTEYCTSGLTALARIKFGYRTKRGQALKSEELEQPAQESVTRCLDALERAHKNINRSTRTQAIAVRSIMKHAERLSVHATLVRNMREPHSAVTHAVREVRMVQQHRWPSAEAGQAIADAIEICRIFINKGVKHE